MTSAQLKQIIDLHEKWLRNARGGERANFSGPT